MNWIFEDIEYKYNIKIEIKKKLINDIFIPEIPNSEEIKSNRKNQKKLLIEKLKQEYDRNETEIRNIIFLIQLSLLKIENYIPLKSNIIYNSESNELIKSILIPNKNSKIVILGNSKGEIILINTNYI